MVALGTDATAELKEFFAREENPFFKARAVWVLAQMKDDSARDFVSALLRADDPAFRILAFRALRLVEPGRIVERGVVLAGDPSPAVRREVAISIRDVPYEQCADLLVQLCAGYDGVNRWYLEALGIGAAKKESRLYQQLRESWQGIEPGKWDDRMKNLAWRLHTREAVADLDAVIRAQKPEIGEFRHLAMAYASFRSDEERDARLKMLVALGELEFAQGEEYQITVSEIVEKDLNDLQGEFLNTSYPMPNFGEPKTDLSDADTIARLPGDASVGKTKGQACLMCHRIGSAGVAFGPNLSQWGRARTVAEIVNEIVDPAAKLAHGYDRPVRLKKGEHVAEGQMSNFSWHAGSLKLKVFGGRTKKILFRRSGARIENLENHSWMPSASQLGLSDQDVRNIAEWLKTR